MRKLVLLVTLSLGGLTFGAKGDLIVNGAFNPTYGSGAILWNGTDLIPAGWGDSPPEVDTNLNVVSASAFPTVVDTPGAGYYMAFESTADDGTQDCLFQIISTIPGQSYTISFWAATTSAASYLQLTPDWDAFTANDQIDSIPALNNGMDPTSSSAPLVFEKYLFTVIADSDSTYLYFHGIDSNGAVLLADVSMTPNGVPEPKSFWFACVGLAIVGLCLHKFSCRTEKRGSAAI